MKFERLIFFSTIETNFDEFKEAKDYYQNLIKEIGL